MSKKKKESFADMLKELQATSVEAKPVEVQEERRYFLVVCEGLRTEPLYFQHLQSFLPKDLIKTVVIEGGAGNTVDVVAATKKLRDEREKSVTTPAFDEAWAVFDKDDFPAERFNQAVMQAGQYGIYTGETNEAFELWYVLHFHYLDTAIGRADYITILSGIWKAKYEKNNAAFPAFLFEKGNVLTAINHAEKLEALHAGKAPAASCPYTAVYKLVKNLMVYAKHPMMEK